METTTHHWTTSSILDGEASGSKGALIIVNQPFSPSLLYRLWDSSDWHTCADGGANRLHDTLRDVGGKDQRHSYLPSLIKGDLDSLRDDVREFYSSAGVEIIQDDDQDATDLMKCIEVLREQDRRKGTQPGTVVILGGLAGRLDQTIHTLSLLHKLRKEPYHFFVATDDNVAWVLDSGTHRIRIAHEIYGPTCGLLPVGIDNTNLTTTGLRWNLTDRPSSFGGLVSTSNHLVPEEDFVTIKTTQPIWWTMELKHPELSSP